MKVYAALLVLTAALASACNTCNVCLSSPLPCLLLVFIPVLLLTMIKDCPGDQVCNHFGGFGVNPSTFCVEPNDPSCNDPRGNCDTDTC